METITGDILDFRRSGEFVEVDMQSDDGCVTQVCLTPGNFRDFLEPAGREIFDEWWGELEAAS